MADRAVRPGRFGSDEIVRDHAENPGREEHRDVAEVGNANHPLVIRKYTGNDQVVGASDQREKAYTSSARSRSMKTREEGRIRSKLATNARIEPIGVVGTAMRRTKCDAPIDATRAAEVLDVDASNEAPKAVANKIDAAAADMLPEVLAQIECGLLDPGAGTVAERKDLFDASETKVRSYREKG